MLNRLLSLFVFCSFGLYAIEGEVSVTFEEKEKRFISEEVIVKIDLKSTAFSVKNVKIGLENSEDYIVVVPKSALFLETIDINDTDWQIVHYEYKLYPLHAGKVAIPPFNITFQASMGYGQPEKCFSFKSTSLGLDVLAPKGVGNNTFVLSTPKYTVKISISLKMNEGNVTQIYVGDALSLTTFQEAYNVPDILLRPVTFVENRYFKVYSEEPKLETKVKGKNSVVSRQDSYTFVASKMGSVTIPSQVFMWWSVKDEVLYKEVTQPYHFEILPNPELVEKVNISLDEENDRFLWLGIGLFILLVFIVVYMFYPKYLAWQKKKKLAYKVSEKGRFNTLRHSDTPQKVYKNFYIWMENINPSLARLGFRGIEEIQPTFKGSLLELEKVLVSKEKEFDRITFINEVDKLRATLLVEQSKSALDIKLNP